MDRSNDALTTWGWGLRRYAWIVVLLVVAVGILVPAAQARSKDVYEAQAQVGPTKPLILPNLDPLPRFAQSVFTNGAVANQVRRLLKLSADQTVIPGTVRLTTAQDNPVMVVYAMSSSPASAVRVADQAAATFVVELNKYSGSVGTFAVQKNAVPPTKPAPKLVGGYLGVILGLLAGLVAGCGLVALILVLRRPVVGAAAAEAVTGLPVLGRLSLPRRGSPDRRSLQGIRAVARRLLTGEHDIVYVTGSVRSQVHGVAETLRHVLARARASEPESPGRRQEGSHALGAGSIPKVVALDTSSEEVWVEPPGGRCITLLLVPEGIRARALDELTEQHAAGRDAAIALVTSHRPSIRTASGRSRAALASEPG